MEIMCLNRNFDVVGYLPYINLQWTRRYHESGEFSAQICMQDYDPEAVYLYTAERPEVGVIEKCRSSTEITGRFVQLSGRFLEGMLSRNVIWPPYTASGKPSRLAYNIAKNYAQDIEGLTFAAYTGGQEEEDADVDYTGDYVDEKTYSLLKGVEKSQRIVYDFANECFVYSIWQGKNRTQAQSTNNYALFSDVSQNTESITIDEDESGYCNVALIGLPDGTSLTVDKRASKLEPRRYLFVDETNGAPKEGQTDAQWKSALKWSANGELLNWPRVNNVEVKTIQSGLLYMTDYDLGDACDIVFTGMQKEYQRRIIEVREVFKNKEHTIEIVFGDKVPTVYERMMNR